MPERARVSSDCDNLMAQAPESFGRMHRMLMPWFLNQLLDIRIGWLDDRHAAEHGELYPMPGGIDRTVDTSTVPTGLLRLSPSEQLQLRR